MADSTFPFGLFVPFILLVTAYFVIDSIPEVPHWVEIVAKVLPDYSLVLAAFFIGKNEAHGPMRQGLSKYSIRIMIALVFCSGGDIFLDVSESTFPIGVGCFLVAHLFFMSAYLIERPCRNGTPCCAGFSWQSLLRCIPAYGYALAIFGVIVSGVPTALIGPLLVYMLALSTMVCCAWSRVGSHRSSLISQYTAAVGAPVFMVSDSLIGLTTFHGHIPGSGYLIMATYYVGIGLITASCFHAAAPEPEEALAGYSAMPASFVPADDARTTSV